MKTSLIICSLAVSIVQSSLAQTAWKDDWRTYEIEETIKFSQRSGRGGWTHAKLIEVFGQPDQAVSLNDFRDQEVGMIYKLKSGLTFRIIKYQDTKTKRYGDRYFATFELIDPQYDKDESTIWTANKSRPLTPAEQKELQKLIDGIDMTPRPEFMPPTDVPPSKLNDTQSQINEEAEQGGDGDAEEAV